MRDGSTSSSYGGDVVVYRSFAPRLDDEPPAFADALAVLDRLQHRLGLLLADDRVARRLARQSRRRTRETLLKRMADPAVVVRQRRRPYRDRPQATATDRAGHYTRLLDRLDAVKRPQDATALSRLHGALNGDHDPSWRKTQQLWGTDAAWIETPPAVKVPDLIDRVLHWAGHTEAPPAVVGSALAGEILAVQPFDEGNDHVAPFLLRLTLHQAGYAGADLIPLKETAVLDEEGAYVLAQALTTDDPSLWIGHCLENLQGAYEETVQAAEFAARLMDETNERQWRLAIWFRDRTKEDPSHPWRFREIHNVFVNVPPRTLKRDLSRLRELGVILMEGKLKSARYRYVGLPAQDPSPPHDDGPYAPSPARPARKSAAKKATR